MKMSLLAARASQARPLGASVVPLRQTIAAVVVFFLTALLVPDVEASRGSRSSSSRILSAVRHDTRSPADTKQSGPAVTLSKSSAIEGAANQTAPRVLLGHSRRLKAASQASAQADAKSAHDSLQKSILEAVAATQNFANLSLNFSVNGSQYPAAGSVVNGRPPRIYFLFLAVDKVSNLELWRRFFTQAPGEQYRAYVHCKLPSCSVQVAGSPLVAVPTVPSYYCSDLVSPMNQLLAVALGNEAGPVNQMDKFVFISDSTLPAKPFSYLYSTLANRQGSDFCVFPASEWADTTNMAGTGQEFAAKHHQWVTLSRSHAEKASMLWANGQLHDFMTRYQMNTFPFSMNDNAFGDMRNYGCLDEFWYMAALYGPLRHTGAFSTVELPLFSGSPLLITAATSWQGTCDTFVMWSQYVPSHAGGSNSFDRFYMSLDPPSVPHPGNKARPGWWDKMSSHGITAIRESEFLFMRKFIDNPHLTDAPTGGGGFTEAYSRLVFNM